MRSALAVALVALAFGACTRASDTTASPSPTATARVTRPPAATGSPAVTSPAATSSPDGRAAARAFVAAFLDARVAGDADRASSFLSAEAKRRYDAREDGLKLVDGYVGWDVESLEAADASSFEVQVRLRGSDVAVESLFVGPGSDHTGAQRPLVIRGALRQAG